MPILIYILTFYLNVYQKLFNFVFTLLFEVIAQFRVQILVFFWLVHSVLFHNSNNGLLYLNKTLIINSFDEVLNGNLDVFIFGLLWRLFFFEDVIFKFSHYLQFDL